MMVNIGDGLDDEIIKEFGFNCDKMNEEELLCDETFKNLFALNNEIDRENKRQELLERAKEIENDYPVRKRDVVRRFNAKYKAFSKEFKNNFRNDLKVNEIKMTNIPLKGLNSGNKWIANDLGIFKIETDKNTFKTITNQIFYQPIIPIELFENIENETEKVKLAFKKNGRWKKVIVDKSVISNRTAIVKLSDKGINVNSENAKDLILFLADVLNSNQEIIPVSSCIDRVGWLNDDFIPYSGNLQFDGLTTFSKIYNDLSNSTGNYEDWKKEALDIRKNSKIMKFLFAASFASVLNKKVNGLPFFVHTWGGTGAGKTVASIAVSSIWGNPNNLIASIDGTQFSRYQRAGFLSDIPVFFDELQLIKGKENYNSIIMKMTEGIDRSKGTKDGDIQANKTWNCVFFTTGEDPITRSNSDGGAKNRVIEIEVTEKLIQDGNHTSNFFRENYGFAGRDFIKNLPDKDTLRKKHKEIFRQILQLKSTEEKQALSVATIMLADELATDLIFKDEKLTLQDILPFVKSKEEIDKAQRAYDWTLDWIAQNIKKFSDGENNYGEVWGKYDKNSGYCLINKKVYEESLDKIGIDLDSILKKMFAKGWIEKNSDNKMTHCTSVLGQKARYIKLIIKQENIENDYESVDICPF